MKQNAVFTALFAAALAHGAFAQPTLDDEPETPPAQPQAAAPQPAAPTGLSLVKLDEQGNMVRYPETLEVAALNLLTLTPEEKSKADAVIAARNEKLDPIVRKNLSIVMRIQSVREEGLNQLITNALREFGQVTPDFRSRDEYRTAIADALGAEKGAQFRVLIAVYRQRWIAFQSNQAKAKGTQDTIGYWGPYESYLTAAEDVRANLDRQISEVPTDTMANIRELIVPTQGQLTIVGPAIDDFKKKVEANSVTPTDKLTLVRRIMQALQDDQRKDLLTKLLPPPIEVMAPAESSSPKPVDAHPSTNPK